MILYLNIYISNSDVYAELKETSINWIPILAYLKYKYVDHFGDYCFLKSKKPQYN